MTLKLLIKFDSIGVMDQLSNHELKCPCCGIVKNLFELTCAKALSENSPMKSLIHKVDDIIQEHISLSFAGSDWNSCWISGLANDDWACDSCVQTGLAIVGESRMFFDVEIECATCRKKFVFPKQIQQKWFEDRGWGDSKPNHCRDCSQKRRTMKGSK